MYWPFDDTVFCPSLYCVVWDASVLSAAVLCPSFSRSESNGKNHHSATASFLLAKIIFSIHLSYAFINSLYPALLFKWFTKRSNTAQQQYLSIINYIGKQDVVIAITWKSWLTFCYRWCFLRFRALAVELFHEQLAKWVAATFMKLYVQKPNFNSSLIFVNTQSYSSADLYFFNSLF